jgi:hypothetical protein
VLSVPYKGSTLSVQVRLASGKLTAAHIAKVRQYLELAEGDLDDGDDAAE